MKSTQETNQLQRELRSLEGSNLEISTEFAAVSGQLLEVNVDYIVLRNNVSLLYILLSSIKTVTKLN